VPFYVANFFIVSFLQLRCSGRREGGNRGGERRQYLRKDFGNNLVFASADTEMPL
jgi:hypothetical protein